MNNNQTFPRLCRVLEIYEADFGCEERPDGQENDGLCPSAGHN